MCCDWRRRWPGWAWSVPTRQWRSTGRRPPRNSPTSTFSIGSSAVSRPRCSPAWRGGPDLVAGDCPVLGLEYHGEADPHVVPAGCYPDPLCLPDAGFLRLDWDEWRGYRDRQAPFRFAFAPDELHKANVSGSTHDIELPQTVADPVLHAVAGRPGVTHGRVPSRLNHLGRMPGVGVRSARSGRTRGPTCRAGLLTPTDQAVLRTRTAQIACCRPRPRGLRTRASLVSVAA